MENRGKSSSIITSQFVCGIKFVIQGCVAVLFKCQGATKLHAKV